MTPLCNNCNERFSNAKGAVINGNSYCDDCAEEIRNNGTGKQ